MKYPTQIFSLFCLVHVHVLQVFHVCVFACQLVENGQHLRCYIVLLWCGSHIKTIIFLIIHSILWSSKSGCKHTTTEKDPLIFLITTVTQLLLNADNLAPPFFTLQLEILKVCLNRGMSCWVL